MLDIINKPNMLHAIVVHMPIALAMLGVPLVFLAVVMSVERPVFRRLALAAYALLAVSAAAATKTGEMARDLVPPTIDTTASNLLETHESLAEAVWIFALATAFFLLLSLIKIKSLRVPWVYRSTMGLAMMLSLVTGGWVAFTGHYGGTLVYEHGIGTRFAEQYYAPKPAPTPDDVAPDDEEDAQANDVMPSNAEPADDWPEEDDPEMALIPIRPIDMAVANEVSYINDIHPIVEAKCLECHEGFDAEGEYWMESVEMMLEEGKKAGPGIIPGQPDESSVIKYVRGEFKPRMPKGEPPLTEDEVHLFRMWIAAGAIDDTDGAPDPAEVSGEGAPAEPATEAEEMVDLTEPAESEAETPTAEEPAPAPEQPAMEEDAAGTQDTEPAPSEPAPAETSPTADSAPEPQVDAPADAAPAPETMEDEQPEPAADSALPQESATDTPEAAPAPAPDVTEPQTKPEPSNTAPEQSEAAPENATQDDPPPDTQPDTEAAPEPDPSGALSISVDEVPNPNHRQHAEGQPTIKKEEQGAILEEPKQPENAQPTPHTPAPMTTPKSPAPKKQTPKQPKPVFHPGDKIA